MRKPNPFKAPAALAALAVCVAVLASCGRDAIFHTISFETVPQRPLVEGAPTGMVVMNWGTGTETRPVMFVAAGNLFWYTPEWNQDGGWDTDRARWGVGIGVPQPLGKIIDIAATREHLYVLSIEGTGVLTTVFRIANGGTGGWQSVGFAPDATDFSNGVQSIFADPAGNWLFAGARLDGAHSVLHIPDDGVSGGGVFSLLSGGETGLLSGAVEYDGTVFLSTRGSVRTGDEFGGIFRVDGNAATRMPGTEGRTFMGMIGLRNPAGAVVEVIAVERSWTNPDPPRNTIAGGLFRLNEDGDFERVPNTATTGTPPAPVGGYMSIGRDATGALALWEGYVDGTFHRMLIAGAQGPRHTTNFHNGYVEFALNANGTLNTGEARRDTGRLLTVDNQERYRTSLGTLPVNHLFQVPPEIDSNRTFFASTQTNGLWSYRVRGNNIPQWNAVSPEDY